MKRTHFFVIAIVVISALGAGFFVWQGRSRNSHEIRVPETGARVESNKNAVESGDQISSSDYEGEWEVLSPPDAIDDVSLELYGARIGTQGSARVDTTAWNKEEGKETPFFFRYPKGANVINESNCYRVEYGFGFVIFLFPVDGDARCGARTGVGVLPDGVDVSDVLIINGERYDAPGFRAIMNTEDDMFKGGKRYIYDFHQMFDYMLAPGGKEESCFQDKTCMRIGYGIYQEVDAPLKKRDIDEVMETLREIVQSVQVGR